MFLFKHFPCHQAINRRSILLFSLSLTDFPDETLPTSIHVLPMKQIILITGQTSVTYDKILTPPGQEKSLTFV